MCLTVHNNSFITRYKNVHYITVGNARKKSCRISWVERSAEITRAFTHSLLDQLICVVMCRWPRNSCSPTLSSITQHNNGWRQMSTIRLDVLWLPVDIVFAVVALRMDFHAWFLSEDAVFLLVPAMSMHCCVPLSTDEEIVLVSLKICEILPQNQREYIKLW